jgi:hypothetical protein
MWGYEMTFKKKIGRNSEGVWTSGVLLRQLALGLTPFGFVTLDRVPQFNRSAHRLVPFLHRACLRVN